MVDKAFLKNHCIAIIENRISSIKAAMEEAQSAANAETKSSVGDKYETARAMNQLEKDMLAKQLAENRKELAAIMQINVDTNTITVQPGSLVSCQEQSFFILGGLGKIIVDGLTIFVISPLAPLAKSIAGKTKGDYINFNTNRLKILDIN